jgi:hypothetical protein
VNRPGIPALHMQRVQAAPIHTFATGCKNQLTGLSQLLSLKDQTDRVVLVAPGKRGETFKELDLS